jgi:hypothetical protein
MPNGTANERIQLLTFFADDVFHTGLVSWRGAIANLKKDGASSGRVLLKKFRSGSTLDYCSSDGHSLCEWNSRRVRGRTWT